MNNFISYFASLSSMRYFFILEIFIAEVLMNIKSKKRKGFAWRAPVGFVLYALVALGMPETFFGIALNSYVTIFIFTASIFICYFVWDTTLFRQVFNCMAAYGIQGFSNDMCVLARVVFETGDSAWRHPIDFIIYVILYLLAYMVFIKQSWKFTDKDIANPLVISLSFGTFLFADLMAKAASAAGIGGHPLVRGILAACIFLGLCFQFKYVDLIRLDKEKNQMEGLLKAEQRQYSISKGTIESVNIKCHDLKHQLQMIRDSIGTGEESAAIDEMENAVEFYDNVAKTGHTALDSVLTEKGLMCKTKDIEFRYMVSSKNLTQIHGHDLYPLMGNALDNAIEATSLVKDPSKRSIFLNIMEKNGFISIHLENYCESEPVFEDGHPVTTKENKNRHGFGTRSIQMIVEKYSGQCVFTYKNDEFILDILIPLEAEK